MLAAGQPGRALIQDPTPGGIVGPGQAGPLRALNRKPESAGESGPGAQAGVGPLRPSESPGRQQPPGPTRFSEAAARRLGPARRTAAHSMGPGLRELQLLKFTTVGKPARATCTRLPGARIRPRASSPRLDLGGQFYVSHLNVRRADASGFCQVCYSLTVECGMRVVKQLVNERVVRHVIALTCSVVRALHGARTPAS